MEFSEKVLTEYLLYLDRERPRKMFGDGFYLDMRFQVYLAMGLRVDTYQYIYQDAEYLHNEILDKRVPQWLIDDIIEWQIREL